MRLGSAGPSVMAPIRKGQLVWDADKGFVRESELKAGESVIPEKLIVVKPRRRSRPTRMMRSGYCMLWR